MCIYRCKEVERMAWVDSATNDQHFSTLPNPVGWIWVENHPPHEPPGWDPQCYWPWENLTFLLSFIPARMRSSPDRAVVIMYKPKTAPPPLVNPLGLRPPSLQRIMGWCCGPSKPNACPIGERLSDSCSHCATVLSFVAVLPANPAAFLTNHRRM